MKVKQKLLHGKNSLKALYARSDCFSNIDWVLFLILAGFCFVSYVHPDLLVTGNRSWLMYDGILNFYDNAVEWTGGYGANYMPSTFLLFAVWILPLKLLGVAAPSDVNDFRLLFTVWYKLLPLLFYIGSCRLFYLLGKEIGLGERKAKIAMYAFMTMPACFYSQFIFAQCDIFTVFFMLWGMYYYYRNQKQDMWRFAVLFGISMSFKYFSLLIFLILLLVREKRVPRIIVYGIPAALPLGLSYVLYRSSPGFQSSVLGFTALDYATSVSVGTISFSSVNLLFVGCGIIAVWAYFLHVDNPQKEIAWTLYLSCGACFILFTFLSSWHPQWLIFLAPFWILSMFINVHLDKFFWLDALAAVVLHFLYPTAFPQNADVNMLRYLAWSGVFDLNSIKVTILDVLPGPNINTLISAFVTIMLAQFLFKHPKYALKDFSGQEDTDHMHLIRLRLILTMGLFTVTAFVAAYLNTVG
ncbi:MAG: hypothetical protein LIO94_00280 [Clostridiales bacterium]|nr:hypothetical protein [Clostridiales bacterium]